MKRKALSASLRWQVFARDGFTCRYCGRQAGMEGVTLNADHVISVADGGDGSMDNLITACERCNQGKGARSLANMPQAEDVQKRLKKRADSIAKQAKAMRLLMKRQSQLEREAVNLKAAAYNHETTSMNRGEKAIIVRLCGEFGSETVAAWYRMACERKVTEWNAIKYVCGIARRVRSDNQITR